MKWNFDVWKIKPAKNRGVYMYNTGILGRDKPYPLYDPDSFLSRRVSWVLNEYMNVRFTHWCEYDEQDNCKRINFTNEEKQLVGYITISTDESQITFQAYLANGQTLEDTTHTVYLDSTAKHEGVLAEYFNKVRRKLHNT